MKILRCTICGSEFSEEESRGISSCPSCGTTSIPCLISNDVEIKINWHELHILMVWAENWARLSDEKKSPEEEKNLLCVMTIAERIQKQHPDKHKLTLFGEIKDLRKELEKGDCKIITNLDDESKLGL